MRFQARRIAAILIPMVFFILDRRIKYLLANNFWQPKCSLINLVKNKGIGFGVAIPEKLEFIFYFLLLIILLILIYRLVKAWPAKNKLTAFALAIIITGALSNIIDRIKYGAVIDFIDLKVWPVFNLADMMITAGVMLLLINSIRPTGGLVTGITSK